MSKVVRFGVSLETVLLKKFDSFIQRLGYNSRSEALRDLIRERLVAEEWKTENKEIIGVLSLVYDHEIRELTDKLTQIQHQYLELIVSSTHIHVDHHNCLEVIILKGKSGVIKNISQELQSTKGVKHGTLAMTTTGEEIK